jgi:hypothetical protein
LSSGQTVNPIAFSSSVNTVGRQHFLNATIFNKTIKLMIDTGSQINLLNIKHVPESIVIQKNDLKISAYNNTSVQVFGFIETDIVIDKIKWGKGRFYIVDNSLNSILGTSTMEDFELVLDLKRKRIIQAGPVQRMANVLELKIDDKNNPNFEGVLLETFTFKPKTETLVDLNVTKIKTNISLFFEESCLNNCKLEFIPSYQEVTPDNPIFRCLIINPSNSAIKILAGTKVIELHEIVSVGQIKNEAFSSILNRIKIGNTSPEIRGEFLKMVKEYSFLFLQEGDFFPACSIAEFSINTVTDKPVCSPPYRTPFALRAELKNILDNYISNGIIEPCISPWNSPSLLVKKKDGRWRLVVDFRKLNSQTHQYHYPLPSLEDSLSYLRDSSVFSQMDLFKGFHQIKNTDETTLKCAFSNEYGQFCFRRMPMGAKNCPAFFMLIMDRALESVPKSQILAYMDDCAVHSTNDKDHLLYLKKFFIILAKNNLRLNAKKCSFFDKEIVFCGYHIFDGRVKPSINRVEAIRNLKEPSSKQEAQSIFGALNFHRKFINNFASIAKPITKTYHKGRFQWTKEASDAFKFLVEAICEKTLELTIPPLDNARYVLECDASNKSFGGCLFLCSFETQVTDQIHLHDENCLKPVAFHSGNFSESQCKYTILEKELLSARICMNKWHVFLKCRNFDWVTDNGNLKYINSLKSNNDRLQRWITDMMSYNYRIIQKPSKSMKMSDCLSRHPKKFVQISSVSLDTKNFADLQRLDPLLRQILSFVKLDRWPNNPNADISCFLFYRNKLKIMDSGELILSSENGDRICVPQAAKIDIIKAYHENCHTGIEITNSRIADKYYWPKMRESVSDFVRSCKYCQLNKPDNNPNKPPVLSFPTPNGPFEAYGFDMIGPLRPTNQGNIYVFTGIDFFSKRAYGVALNSKKSDYLLEKFKDLLFRNPIFPKYMIFDNAPEFCAIRRYCENNNIKINSSPPRHPSTNGAVENLNRTLKSRLRAKCNFLNWDEVLYEILHEINSSVHSVTKLSPFTIETGIKAPHSIFDHNWRKYTPKLDIKFEKIRDNLEKEKQKRLNDFKNVLFCEYNIGDKILIRNFRAKKPPFLGPFTVVEKAKTVYSCKEDETGKTFIRHANDIKRYIERPEKFSCRISEKELDEVQHFNVKLEDSVCGFADFSNFNAPSFDSGFDSFNSNFLPNAFLTEDATEKRNFNEIEINLIENSEISLDNARPKFDSLSSTSDSLTSDLTSESDSELEQLINKKNENNRKLLEAWNEVKDEAAANLFDKILNEVLLEIACKSGDESNLSFNEIIEINSSEKFESDSGSREHLDNDLTEIPELESSVEIDEIVTGFMRSQLNDIENFGEATGPVINDREKNLISYDKLNLDFSEPKTQKRRRSSNDSLEIPEPKKISAHADPNQTILVDSEILNEPVKIPKVKLKGDRLMVDPDNMHIFIKLENEEPEFFANLDREYKNYKQNAKIENGCVLKLSELTKEVLINILNRFKTDHSPKENRAELTRKIKYWIIENQNSWSKTLSEDYLFLAFFRPKKSVFLSDLSLPELKCLASFYDLPKIPYYSKPKLCDYINEIFSSQYPEHTKSNFKLIFHPDT